MLIIITTVIAISTVSLFLIHRSLNSNLHASHHTSLPLSIDNRITSIPKEILVSSNAYSVFYDRASRPVPRRLLPNLPLGDLLKCLLRRNMATFSHFPQAWLLRLSISAADRQSFSPSYVRSLEFKEGDLVCGVYRVVARRENQVELGMTKGPVMGRLVVGYEVDQKKEMVVFSTETIMWKRKDEGGASIPLENPVIRFFHDMTAWWLIASGVRFLMDLDASECDEKVAFEDGDPVVGAVPFE